jgi:hypothetical protein
LIASTSGSSIACSMNRSAVEVVQLREVRQVEHPLDVDDLGLVVDLHLVDQEGAHVRVHPGGHLEADDLAEAPLTQLLLDRTQQVVCLVRDGEVGVARDPERSVGADLHSREQPVEPARDDVLERDADPVGDLDEARQHLLRHLHAREQLGVALRVAEPDAEAQREVRDVGERPPRSDCQRCQDGEDLLFEDAVYRGALLLRAGRDVDDPDLVLGQPWAYDVLPLVRMAPHQRQRGLGQADDRLKRREAVGLARVDPRVDLVVQAGDADHRELVEVRREDREELRPLEQRRALVLGQLEHALVEVEPRQLAVRVELVRVERRGCGRRAHAFILPS